MRISKGEGRHPPIKKKIIKAHSTTASRWCARKNWKMKRSYTHNKQTNKQTKQSFRFTSSIFGPLAPYWVLCRPQKKISIIFATMQCIDGCRLRGSLALSSTYVDFCDINNVFPRSSHHHHHTTLFLLSSVCVASPSRRWVRCEVNTIAWYQNQKNFRRGSNMQ